MEGDPFFKERWHEKAAHEHGEEAHDKRIELYFSLLERGEQDPTLKSLTHDLEQAIGTYAQRVVEANHALSTKDKMVIETTDSHRTLAHDVLIGAVNAVSRWYGKHKLDNQWRRDIIGLDRRELGAWALHVARYVLGKETE
jgi:hypothetical protein